MTLLSVREMKTDIEQYSVLHGVSFDVAEGGVFVLLGRNGAGKTTFLRMLVGDEKPDSGSIELGDTVALSYVDQSRDALNGDNTVWQEISDGHEQLVIGLSLIHI